MTTNLKKIWERAGDWSLPCGEIRNDCERLLELVERLAGLLRELVEANKHTVDPVALESMAQVAYRAQALLREIEGE